LGYEYLYHFVSGGLYAASITLFIAIVVCSVGCIKEESNIKLAGVALFIAAVAKQLFSVVFLAASAAPWMTLGILGVLLIVIGSVVERHADKIKELSSRFLANPNVN
jgi:hypothetical protein